MSNSYLLTSIPSFRSLIYAGVVTSVVVVFTAGVASAASPRRRRAERASTRVHHPHSAHSSLTIHELRLVDATGKARMILSTEGGHPTINMLDVRGRVLMSAFLDSHGLGSIQLTNPVDGYPQAAFALDDKGAHVKFDREGGASSYIFLNNRGESGAVFLDTQGRRRLDLLVRVDGQTTIERLDDAGKPYQ